MALKNLVYYCREAVRSLFRNSWFSVTSIGIVAISLIILGISVLLVINANTIAASVESDVEITVFMVDEATERQVEDLKNHLGGLSGVEEVRFIPREEGLESMRESLGDVVDGMEENNPLPHAFRIKTQNAGQVQGVALQVERLIEVDKVRYGQGFVEKLLSVTAWVRMAGLIGVALLTASAVFLIASTIRLSVYARHKEINIMKFLGATNWFVRGPFLLEGMILGFAGALLASVVVIFSYQALASRISVSLTFLFHSVPLGNDLFLQLTASLLVLGLLIGALGSILSLRKHLEV